MATDPPITRGWYNGAHHYGRVSQIFHWTSAILMTAAIALGLLVGNFPRGTEAYDSIILIHKSIGFMILPLTILRLSWFLRSPPPVPSAKLRRWERGLAWIVHRLLYVLLFAMPLSGILLSQSAGKTVDIFGLFTLPQFVPLDPALPPGQRPQLIAGVILHKLVFKVTLFVLIGAHVAGVIKHVVIDKDRASLRRMWGRTVSPDIACVPSLKTRTLTNSTRNI